MGAAPRPAGPLRFTKMHGAGNDFIVLDLRAGQLPPTPALCRALADRHTGVGCDQLLTIEPPRAAGSIASYRVWNADGSAAGQCGNGARCIAAWLVRDGAVAGRPAVDKPAVNAQAVNEQAVNEQAVDRGFVVDSPNGSHLVECLSDGRYRIAMGVPDFRPQAIPLAGFDAAQDAYTLDIDGRAVRLGAVSMGNPHALIEVDDVAQAPVVDVGAALQGHPAFPDSVNVGFAHVRSSDRVDLRVYERGAGETLACGSGACAAAAILIQRGRIGRQVTIVLPGGELQVDWPADHAPITMAGPAAFVFEGDFPT